MTREELLEKVVAEQHSGSPDEVGGLCARRYEFDALGLTKLLLAIDKEHYEAGSRVGHERRKLKLVS